MDAAARAWFDQARQSVRAGGLSVPEWDDLAPVDQHNYRSLVLPIVAAAAPVVRGAALAEAAEEVRSIDYVAELEHGDNGDWMREETLRVIGSLRGGGDRGE